MPEMGKEGDVLYTVTYSRIPGTDMGVMEFTWLGDEPLTITPDGLVIIADSEITDENDLGVLYRALS